MQEVTILQYVAKAHGQLVIGGHPTYQDYWAAKTDADAVEGALWIDTAQAAKIIRDWAGLFMGAPDCAWADALAGATLQTIVDALLTITRRQDRIDAAFKANAEAEVERWSRDLEG